MLGAFRGAGDARQRSLVGAGAAAGLADLARGISAAAQLAAGKALLENAFGFGRIAQLQGDGGGIGEVRAGGFGIGEEAQTIEIQRVQVLDALGAQREIDELAPIAGIAVIDGQFLERLRAPRPGRWSWPARYMMISIAAFSGCWPAALAMSTEVCAAVFAFG